MAFREKKSACVLPPAPSPSNTGVGSMVVSGSPKRWDRWHIIPQLAGKMPRIYHLYSLPSGELYNPYHRLGEPFQQPLIGSMVQKNGLYGKIRAKNYWFRPYCFPFHPWDWYIYLTTFGWFLMVKYGKCRYNIAYMDGLGLGGHDHIINVMAIQPGPRPRPRGPPPDS